MRQTLLQLPIRQRAALILREVIGLSCAEIGDLLNISRDAVKMALWRAREQFRARYLGEEGGSDEPRPITLCAWHRAANGYRLGGTACCLRPMRSESPCM